MTPQDERLKLFVEAYLAGATAVDSAKAAGHKGTQGALRVTGSRLLARANEAGLLAKRADAIAETMGAERVVKRLWSLADADMGDFIETPVDGTFKFTLGEAKAKGLTRLIKKLKHDPETGAPVVELQDSAAALKTLARIYGLEKPKEQGGQVTVNVLAFLGQLDHDTLENIRAAALKALPETVDAA